MYLNLNTLTSFLSEKTSRWFRRRPSPTNSRRRATRRTLISLNCGINWFTISWPPSANRMTFINTYSKTLVIILESSSLDVFIMNLQKECIYLMWKLNIFYVWNNDFIRRSYPKISTFWCQLGWTYWLRGLKRPFHV